MKKIIPLSDLPHRHKECGDRFRLIIESISGTCQPSSDYIAVITGDIADNAFRREHHDEAAAGIYDTVYVDSAGVVSFADDYYGHDAKLVEALAHGFPYPRTR